MSYDVFSEENRVKANWFQTKIVGNTLKGTFINKEQKPNFLQGGALAWVYTVRTETGDIWFVQGKPAIDAQMKFIKLGQIIGFKYIGESTKHAPGKAPAKIVQVFQNPKLVDEAWLQEQEEVNRVTSPDEDEGVEGGPNGMNIDDIPGFDKAPTKAPEVTTGTDKLNLIGELAKTKLGVTDAANVKVKVMEATNLAFIDSNLDQILSTLQALPDLPK